MDAERRLRGVMVARLVLTLASLGVVLGLEALGEKLPGAARNGLYETVAFSFATTVVSALALRWRWSLARMVALQVATDACIASSLVYFTGGRESVFTFLYVLIVVYGAVLFRRSGALMAASVSGLAYAAVVFGERVVDMPDTGYAPTEDPLSVEIVTWGVLVAALFLVGLLASVLSGELHRTGRALELRTHDLNALRDLYRRTVESIMSGLLTVDLGGTITSFNPEAERITGLTARQAIGRRLEDVIPGAMEVAIKEQQGERRGPPGRKRMVYDNARGQERWLGLAGSILRREDGDPMGHVVIFTDVTDVVSMEGELRRSERMAAVGEMAAKIAHEIRNPLASISGSIEILKGAGGSSEGLEQDALMDIVIRETDRLNQLITDFLQFSRPAEPLRRRVVLGDLAEEVLQVLQGTLPPDIRAEGPGGDDLAALGDPGQLRQVVWNLCLNAVQAMPKGGCLRVDVNEVDPRNMKSARGSVEGPRAFVELVISDTGEGIPEELQAQVFEPFFTTKEEGTGLGLATVHSVVERHDGELVLESRLGLGTTFRVRLPRYEES